MIPVILTITTTKYLFNFSPNDKILDWTILKDLADDKINVTQKLNFILGMAEKTWWGKEKNKLKFVWGGGRKTLWEKGENADYQHQHFPFFHNVFKRLLSRGHLK